MLLLLAVFILETHNLSRRIVRLPCYSSACVAWRFWLLSNKDGRGQKNLEDIGAGATEKPPARTGGFFESVRMPAYGSFRLVQNARSSIKYFGNFPCPKFHITIKPMIGWGN